MHDNDLWILRGADVDSLLSGRELEIMQTVEDAYLAHAAGRSNLPHSTFLRFPDSPQNRIIGLPAYLGDRFDTAGIKWVSSFPDNLKESLDRASAVVILNSTSSGRPEVIMEGSIISARRTAAGAALAAKYLAVEGGYAAIGIIGCGLINYETIRFLRLACPEIRRCVIFDLNQQRATQFKDKCSIAFDGIQVEIADEIQDVWRENLLISLATTAGEPHLFDPSISLPARTILHLSLRDFSPEVILACDNIVDDSDHVCRAQTSLHLAELATGNRDFITCSLADLMAGEKRVARRTERAAIFSPFGLGILDLAISKLVYRLAVAEKKGIRIEAFQPPTWTQRT